MTLKERLYNNVLFRNLVSIFGERSEYSNKPGDFIPYFQYKVGPYQQDFYLYFPREPLPALYRNEIFNKMAGYRSFDITRYLDFHFEKHADKEEFLRFLHYELIRESKIKKHREACEIAQQWVAEKEQILRNIAGQVVLQDEVTTNIKGFLKAEGLNYSDEKIDMLVETVTTKLSPQLEEALSGFRQKLKEMSDSYITGNIRLSSDQYLQALIQLFYVLQNLQRPSKRGVAPTGLFSSFSATDLASLLHLHFYDFKEKQLNTIQKEITKANEAIDINSEKIKRLDKALRDLFFE